MLPWIQWNSNPHTPMFGSTKLLAIQISRFIRGYKYFYSYPVLFVNMCIQIRILFCPWICVLEFDSRLICKYYNNIKIFKFKNSKLRDDWYIDFNLLFHKSFIVATKDILRLHCMIGNFPKFSIDKTLYTGRGGK